MSDLRRFDTAYVNFLRKIHEAGRVPCEGRGNLFFPDDLPNPEARKLATKVAKRLCQECPILQECLLTRSSRISVTASGPELHLANASP